MSQDRQDTLILMSVSVNVIQIIKVGGGGKEEICVLINIHHLYSLVSTSMFYFFSLAATLALFLEII